MPNSSLPYYEIQDGDLLVRFYVDPQAEFPIRISPELAGTPVSEFELSVTGAQRFSMVLSSALSRAINGGR